MNSKDLQNLKRWFLAHRRDLPWRQDPSPYAVWVSEVMLQQTQVSVVIPYFLRWMQRFPTISHLANAPIDEVLKEWEGLGYYSRARNLHAGAKYCVDNFAGQLPDSAKSLSDIKGLGPYTIGAILSFAFHQRMPAVDGNVLRVLARYYAISDDISKSKTIKHIQNKAALLLPKSQPWIISEALIELGATVCTRLPKCIQCPLKQGCHARLNGDVDKLPMKSTKSNITQLHRAVAVIACNDLLLVQRGITGKVMQDLYEFPYLDLKTHDNVIEQLNAHFTEVHALKLKWKSQLPEVRHSFTRFKAHLKPHFFTTFQAIKTENCEWLSIETLKKMPFSSGHRQIFAHCQRELIPYDD